MAKQTISLAQLRDLFEETYRSEYKSELTIDRICRTINSFISWIQKSLNQSPTLASLIHDSARAWILALQKRTVWEDYEHINIDRPLAEGTVGTYIQGLKAFASWLAKEGYTKENLLTSVKIPQAPDREVEILSQAEIARIMHSFNQHTETGARDLAIFSLLLDTGMRAGELCGLRMQNLHLDQGYMIVFGKRKKERPVKVGSRSVKTLRFYLAHWRKPARANIDNVFLTVGNFRRNSGLDLWGGAGRPLTVDALQRILTRTGEKVNVPRLHPHLLRHTFACLFLMEHHDPFALKNLLGHISLDMTYRYVRAVERLMIVQGGTTSVLDSIELPAPSNRKRKEEA